MPHSFCRTLVGLLAAGLAAAAPLSGLPPTDPARAPAPASPSATATSAPSSPSPSTSTRERDPFAGQARLERAAFLRLVVQRNPALAALRLGWRAAAARRRGAAELPLPSLSLALAPLATGGG